MYIYIYVYIYICMYIYIYMYIYISSPTSSTLVSLYIVIYARITIDIVSLYSFTLVFNTYLVGGSFNPSESYGFPGKII